MTVNHVRLFHFSEEADIRVFTPRPPQAHPEVEPLVWAIDEWHSFCYLSPRDCPRACFWARGGSSRDDIERFLGQSQRVIAIQSDWLEALKAGVLYRYEFDPATFELHGQGSGHHVSRASLGPIDVQRLDNLPGLIDAAGVELRVVDDLLSLHWQIATSTLMFSNTRMRNLPGYEEPVPPLT